MIAAQSGGTAPDPASAVQADAAPARDSEGRVVVHATRVIQPLQLDGRLNEDEYARFPAFTGLVQQEPNPGEPVTERTEAWVMFDDENIYVACRCWDEHPERIVANDMRRDSTNHGVSTTTSRSRSTRSYDRRNGFLFGVTPTGGLRDGDDHRRAGERRLERRVWDAKASRFEGGWIAEMAIPFKIAALQARPASRRGASSSAASSHSKNETAYLTPISPAWGISAINRLVAGRRRWSGSRRRRRR